LDEDIMYDGTKALVQVGGDFWAALIGEEVDFSLLI
jgi:hypothetical protein